MQDKERPASPAGPFFSNKSSDSAPSSDGRKPRSVALLPDEVARKIAAGEVIERPASVIRELIDNSIDAGAGEIEIEWDGGGLERIRVRDDGWGMPPADLELCYRSHATSKVRSLDELSRAETLGFRGEALSSIASVSELTVMSRPRDSEHGASLRIRRGQAEAIRPAPMSQGTILEVRQLFSDMPARRKFIGNPQTESRLNHAISLEKALPYPTVSFRFGSGTGRTTALPAQTLTERVAACFGRVVTAERLHVVEGSGQGFRIAAVAADPDVVRRDRRNIHIYVNGRRVNEYRLVQGVEYAYTDVQHGGLFPVAAILVFVDPELADFNVHPAKREVRLRNGAEIRSRLVEVLRSFLRAYVVKTVQFGGQLGLDAGPSTGRPGTERPSLGPPGPDGPTLPGVAGETLSGYGTRPFEADGTDPTGPTSTGASGSVIAGGDRGPTVDPFRPLESRSSADRALDRDRARSAAPHRFDRSVSVNLPQENGTAEVKYVGQLFGTFVVVQKGASAYLIDQHAAHERLLYDRFRESQASQPLLVPEEFQVSEDQDEMLAAHRDEFARIGIQLERTNAATWQLKAAPAVYRDSVESLIDVILGLEPLQEGFDREVIADLACKAAVKRGDYLDELSALDLARRTFELQTPRCPHGRPLWIELSQGELFRLIGRE